MDAAVRELQWAWRGVRGRGWRAMVIVMLFAVALASNTVVFSAADAFLFSTAPYREPGRLAIIERVDRGVPTDAIWPRAIRGWRDQRDLFAGLQLHSSESPAYLTTSGLTDAVRGRQITAGLLELLGVLPSWGRPFTAADGMAGAPPVSIISERLAGRLFGAARTAIGQTIVIGRIPHAIIGVMPASFRFPTAAEEFWTPLDFDSWPGNASVPNIVRLAAGRSFESAAHLVAERAATVSSLGGRPNESIRLRVLGEARNNPNAVVIFGAFLGAAACLLLIACANVASLEIASAAGRARAYAVQAALGASRSSLVRIALLEGVLLLAISLAVAVLLTGWGTAALDRQLTNPMRDALTNPLDLDFRAVALMILAAVLTWLVTAVPTVMRVSKVSVIDGLRDDPRTAVGGRSSARSRQLLVSAQVALTVLLLVGSVLYVRTYHALITREKGFDASGVATVEVVRAPDEPRAAVDIERDVLERLRNLPGASAASRTSTLPPTTISGNMAALSINDGTPSTENVMVHFGSVDPEYFTTMGIAIVEGQPLRRDSARDDVVIDQRFARRYWPAGSAVGSRFRIGSTGYAGVSEFRVAGVSRELRTDRIALPTGEEAFVVLIGISPTSHPLRFVVRLTDDRLLSSVDSAVKSVAGRSVVRTDTIEARYARLNGDTRLAASVTSGFGLVAFMVAVSGVYAVMAYLVAARRREIGIRMALGADRRDVQKLVFGSSLRFVVLGSGVGLGAAAVASRAISTQLFGVTATDPPTYAIVTVVVIGASAVATWWPARRASQIDPAITLRAE